MGKKKFVLWIIVLFFGFQLAGCTYQMQKPPSAGYQDYRVAPDPLGIYDGKQ